MTIRLAWQATGPRGAPVLVLLNSLGSNTAMWDPEVNSLAEQFVVVRVDHRGHGESGPSPAGTPCSLADLGADAATAIEDVCREFDVQKVHLAGLSLGGMVAMWLAAHRGELVDRLALLCTSAHLPPAPGWIDRAATARQDGMAELATAVTSRWVTPGLAERDPELVSRLQEMVRAADPESYGQCCEAIAAMDLRADLPRIAAPTLVIAGEQDPATPPTHAEVIVAGIAGSRLEVLSPAAHLVTAEQPGAVTALLLGHFRGGATVQAGFARRRKVLGDAHVDRAIEATTELTAPFQEFITRYAWGDIWTRPGLSQRDRSMVTLAALVALGADHEIAMHVRAGLGNGLTAAEISEVLLHTAVYAGLPRANRAFSLAQQVIAEQNE